MRSSQLKSEWTIPLASRSRLQNKNYKPVAANQDPVPLVTKMIGAMQG
jgi:hypothetical protein